MVRSRGVGTLVSLSVVMVLSGVGLRSCQQSSPSSPSNPDNVARNGIAGVCADRQAVQQADGLDPASDPASSDPASSDDSLLTAEQLAELERTNPAGLAAITKAAGGLSCPTTTLP